MPRRSLPRLRPVSPHPDGDALSVAVPCAASPDLADATRHPISIGPDWTVTTPHDLDAERVASAFGGYSTCLVLVERVLPAIRAMTQWRARRVVPRLRRGARGSWAVAGASRARCCRPAPRAGDAAAHLRGLDHLWARADAPGPLVSRVADAVDHAHRGAGTFVLAPDDLDTLRRCVHPGTEPVEAWEAGLHPDVVAAVHDHVVGADGPPLPLALYLGVVTRRPDLAWLADTLARVDGGTDDPTLAEWLTWTHTPLDRRAPRARSGWIATGTPRAWILELSAAGYTPDDAERLAAATGRSAVGAADLLRGWVAAGCRPEVAELADVHRSGVPAWSTPSGAAIDRLTEMLGDDLPTPGSTPLTRTELGLLLVREGTVTAAAGQVHARPRTERSSA